MKARSFSAPLPWALVLAGAVLAVACGEDGVTPNCPELPLYDVRDPETLDDPEIQEALDDAVEAECLTRRADSEAGAAGSP